MSEYGYYQNINPFFYQQDKVGDFITSPQLSQIFGELIGLWLVDLWDKCGKVNFNLLELGAGSGALINDILRATSKVDGFHKSLSLHIVEINPILQNSQKQLLNKYPNIIKKTTWHQSIDDVKLTHLTFIYSNEFFDSLPIKQYVCKNNQLYEVFVEFNNNNQKLQLVLNKDSILKNDNYKENDVLEFSTLANEIYNKLLNIIKSVNGVILSIDYGGLLPSKLSSLRGYLNGKLLNMDDILNNAGLCDITYNVNFGSFLELANKNNIDCYNLITQKDFLTSLGFEHRRDILANNLLSQEKENFLKKCDLLINENHMGEKFKVMLNSFGVGNPYGFYKIGEK